jgi:hypothetical protein
MPGFFFTTFWKFATADDFAKVPLLSTSPASRPFQGFLTP